MRPASHQPATSALRLLALTLLALTAACDEAETRRGDVLLVILDTTRADHLSAYGYTRPTTPNLDRLAAEGQRFSDAWAQSPWTLPAMATILTGQPPHAHGATRFPGGLSGLRPGVRTLAERLHAAGRATAAFINVVWCDPRLSALDRGFDVYDFHGSDATNRGNRDAAATTAAALDWLDRIGDASFFMVVHYFDPHLTYDPPAPYDTLFESDDGARITEGFGSASEVFRVRDGSLALDAAQRASLIARYDGELRYTDEQFGKLREGLERRGRWDDALVIVIADHGEEFWDHGGFEHGHSHHRELLHVPLIVKRPGAASAVQDERVRQLDVAPTVLDFAGLPLPAELPGRVLGTGAADHAVGEGSLWAGDLVSVRSDAGTLILDRGSGQATFYAPEDPDEQHPLPTDGPNASQLLRLAEAIPTVTPESDQTRELTEEQREQLRSLGYLK